jgi:hypothetical protein
MRKFALIGLVALALSAALVAFAADVPETILIDECAKKKAPVEFPHKAHFEFTDCVTCHHTSEGLTAETVASMEVQKCGACHIEPEKAETPACGEMSAKKNPYHINCIGCHKEAVAKNAEAKAPTKCNDCHPKPAG